MKYTDHQNADNPHFRIREVGAKGLSLSETLSLALFINESETTNALANLVQEFGTLNRIPRHRITEIKGLGDKCADAIEAIAELTRREVMAQIPEKFSVRSPADAAELVRYEMGSLPVEELRVILLNTRNQVMRVLTTSRGSTNSASVRVSEVFQAAVRENAMSIIVVHNHPSGDPTPSPEDVALTRALVQSGKLMDIQVLDHMVIGLGRWISMKEKGLGF